MEGYPHVHIINSTPYQISGSVQGNDFGCSDHNYAIAGECGNSWTADSRGLCLVATVTATVVVNGVGIAATSYQSSGTAHSQFAVIMTNNNPPSFSVTRLTED